MPRIELELFIDAPIEICFDLSRSIDLHRISTAKTGEEAIAGVTSGLIGLHETVTWRARHLGVMQTLTTRITEFDRPKLFVDEMLQGVFKSFRHEHHFKKSGTGTRVWEVFDYVSPLGFLGEMADRLFLENYMRGFLLERNRVIKEYAETNKWKCVLLKEEEQLNKK